MNAKNIISEARKNKAQITLEFLLVYSLVLIVFLIIFALIVAQRASTLASQEYSSMQLVAQTVSTAIDTALSSGSGYTATVQLPSAFGTTPYNLSISSTGVIIASMPVGKEVVSAQAFSDARSLVVNGTVVASGNGITLYKVPAYKGSVYIANSNGVIYIDQQPVSTLALAKYLNVNVSFNGKVAQFNGQNGHITVSAIPGLTYVHTTVLWINPATVNPSLNLYAIDMGGNNNWIQLYDAQSNGHLEVRAGSNGNCYINGLYQFNNANTWYFVAVTETNTPVLTIYVNGVLDNSGTACTTNPSAITIGEYSGGGEFFDGQIADIQIYNTSLSAAQIQQLYQEGLPTYKRLTLSLG